jgi:NADPH-dependent F420 reductase
LQDFGEGAHVVTYTIAVIGGTGPQGRGLAYRFARHGHTVVLGSRAAERAEQTAAEIRERVPDAVVSGAENAAAAESADVVVLAVPYDGHDELVAGLAEVLAGKTLVSCVNPLGFDKAGPYGLDVPGGSAAETAASLVPSAHVVGAFHHVSAVSLWGEADYLDHEDVLVCGDDQDAKQVVIDLARSVTGRDGVDGGALRLARQLEPLTAVLISINKRYRTRSGVAISGIPT